MSRRLLTALAISVACASLAAQEPVFRSTVEVVRLDVSAVRDDEPTRMLKPQDLIVTDNGVPQEVVSLTLDQQPLSVLMVLDTSASMTGDKLNHLADAARAIVASLRPTDRAAIIGFSHAVQINTGLTANRDRLNQAIGSLQAGGATSLRDALFAALQLTPVDDSRPMVLLFTDGDDNSSWLTDAEVMEAVRRTAVTVDIIDVPETRSATLADWDVRVGRAALPARRFLQQVVDASGGRAWSSGSPRDLRDLFVRALADMRGRYVLSFYPRGVSRDGWHRVEVKLRGPGAVRARPGYYVTPMAFRPDGDR